MLISTLERPLCNYPHNNIMQYNITEQDSSVQYFMTHEVCVFICELFVAPEGTKIN